MPHEQIPDPHRYPPSHDAKPPVFVSLDGSGCPVSAEASRLPVKGLTLWELSGPKSANPRLHRSLGVGVGPCDHQCADSKTRLVVAGDGIREPMYHSYCRTLGRSENNIMLLFAILHLRKYSNCVVCIYKPHTPSCPPQTCNGVNVFFLQHLNKKI